MHIAFADDARQKKPSRAGMSALVAIGGVIVPFEAVATIEGQLDNLCTQYDFPPGEEGRFKWSPNRDTMWMYSNLIDEKRQHFWEEVLEIIKQAGVKAVVVIEDTAHRAAMGTADPEVDTLKMFIERVSKQFEAMESTGLMIVERPSGGTKGEKKFLVDCHDTLVSGTAYVMPDKIVLNALCTPSRYVRLLQVADLVTSCTLAYVSGESTHSPPVFAAVKPLLASDTGRIGGVGLKLHPDGRYANLYHWLLGDNILTGGIDLPRRGPYAAGPNNL